MSHYTKIIYVLMLASLSVLTQPASAQNTAAEAKKSCVNIGSVLLKKDICVGDKILYPVDSKNARKSDTVIDKFYFNGATVTRNALDYELEVKEIFPKEKLIRIERFNRSYIISTKSIARSQNGIGTGTSYGIPVTACPDEKSVCQGARIAINILNRNGSPEYTVPGVISKLWTNNRALVTAKFKVSGDQTVYELSQMVFIDFPTSNDSTYRLFRVVSSIPKKEGQANVESVSCIGGGMRPVLNVRTAFLQVDKGICVGSDVVDTNLKLLKVVGAYTDNTLLVEDQDARRFRIAKSSVKKLE